MQRRRVPMIEQFHLICHPHILNVVDVVTDGHYGYGCIAASLGLGESSWSIVQNNLYRELSQWRDDYATLVGSYDRLKELRRSLLEELQSAVCVPIFHNIFIILFLFYHNHLFHSLQANETKWMTIPNTDYTIVNRYNVYSTAF